MSQPERITGWLWCPVCKAWRHVNGYDSICWRCSWDMRVLRVSVHVPMYRLREQLAEGRYWQP